MTSEDCGLILLRQGSQGILDAASHASLENEFGTHKEEDVVKQILEKGTVQETEVRETLRQTVCL